MVKFSYFIIGFTLVFMWCKPNNVTQNKTRINVEHSIEKRFIKLLEYPIDSLSFTRSMSPSSGVINIMPSKDSLILEIQLQCLDLIPNSGIAITLDLGDENWIHPPKKKEVADRLLFNALNQTSCISCLRIT